MAMGMTDAWPWSIEDEDDLGRNPNLRRTPALVSRKSAVYSIFVIFKNSNTARQRLSDWLQHLRTVRHH
jgi:hypothetical protein